MNQQTSAFVTGRLGRWPLLAALFLSSAGPLMLPIRGQAPSDGRAEEQLAVQQYYRNNNEEALTHFRAAAAAGDSEAYSFLGIIYANGYGVPKDPTEAAGWFQKSVNTGHLADQTRLNNVMSQLNPGYAPAPVNQPDNSQVVAQQAPAQTQQMQNAQAASQAAAEAQERQNHIDDLNSDIERNQSDAEMYDNTANNMDTNCGVFTAVCVAKQNSERNKANKCRQQIETDRQNLANLEASSN